MTTSVDKYAEYKLAPPLERSKRSLSQGKLNKENVESLSLSLLSNSSGHNSLMSDQSALISFLNDQSNNGLESSPRRPLLPHMTGYPTTDHTHSLSLSDTGSPPPSSSPRAHLHTPTPIVPGSSSESVLVVRALDSTPSHSQPVKTTTTKALSPVKVTRHFNKTDNESLHTGPHVANTDALSFNTDPATLVPPDQLPPDNDNWRRFSSSFVSAPINSARVGESSIQTGGAHATNLSTIVETSLAATVGNDDRDVDADSLGSVSVEGDTVRREGVEGVGRSASDQILTKTKTKPPDASLHSRSMDVSSTKGPPTAVKKKPPKSRIVSSRYMSSATSLKKPPPSQSGRGKTASLKTGQGPHRTLKSKTTSKLPPQRSSELHKPSQRRGPPPSMEKPSTHTHPFTPSHNTSALSVSFSPSGLVTSTPHHPQGGVHDGSFIAMETGRGSTVTVGDNFKKQLSEVDELELLHTRLLQSTYLNILSAQSLKEQEQEAKAQLYTLWKAVENKKREELELRKNLETERRNIALDNTLDIQLQGLGPVVAGLTQLERSHTAMTRALDATRHDLPLNGMLPVDQEELTETLAETEELLGEIMMSMRDKIPAITSFAERTDAVVSALRNELEELEKCQSSLETVTKLQLHEASLFLESKHRTSS